MPAYKLLTAGNPKTIKGETQQVYTVVLHLAPGALSGHQVCPMATEGCLSACLNTAGRGGIIRKGEVTNAIQQARIRRTQWFFTDRESFMRALAADVIRAQRYADAHGYKLAVRLNGTSDIPWEKIRAGEYRNIMAMFPAVQFYDYTKIFGRTVPGNYHLTFSRGESNGANVARALNAGLNVTVVFAQGLPATWAGRPVIDGDESDLRFMDPAGVIVGLKAKGKARRDTSGFVVR